MTEAQVERAHAATRVQRWTFTQTLLGLALLVVFVGGALFATFAVARQSDIRDSVHSQSAILKRQECISEINAEFQAAVGDALLAPPAPNAARTDAVMRIQSAAEKLHHLERYCP